MLHILHCPLSGPDLIYISLLIIFCIIEYVTNKKTLTLERMFLYCKQDNHISNEVGGRDAGGIQLFASGSIVSVNC